MFLTKTDIDDVPVSMKMTELVLELGQKENVRKQYILSVCWDEVLSRIAFNYVYQLLLESFYVPSTQHNMPWRFIRQINCLNIHYEHS